MTGISRRSALGASLAMLASGAVCAQQRYPSRSVNIVVGFPPGGATDASSRVMQPLLQRIWDQPVIVENAPGAGGSIAVQRMLSAGNPGHSIFIGTGSDVVLTPLAIQNARYRADNLRLLSLIGKSPFVIAARPDLPFANLDELIEHAKKGKGAPPSFASFGNGTLYHLLGEDLAARTGGRLLHVPFQGMGPTITNLGGGHVDIAFLPVAGQTADMVKSGRLRALALTRPQRDPLLPAVPSVDESKLAKGFYHDVWVGAFGPADLPDDMAAAVNSAFAEVLRAPEYVRFAQETGSAIPEQLPMPALASFYRAETASLTRLAQSLLPASK